MWTHEQLKEQSVKLNAANNHVIRIGLFWAGPIFSFFP
jgi:hypothetical protein